MEDVEGGEVAVVVVVEGAVNRPMVVLRDGRVSGSGPIVAPVSGSGPIVAASGLLSVTDHTQATSTTANPGRLAQQPPWGRLCWGISSRERLKCIREGVKKICRNRFT